MELKDRVAVVTGGGSGIGAALRIDEKSGYPEITGLLDNGPARKSGKVKEGDLVVLAAFGSGFTWGSVIMRWT